MSGKTESVRFYVIVGFLSVAAFIVGVRLLMLHMDLVTTRPKTPTYVFKRDSEGLRGGIYPAAGTGYPLAHSVQVWDYHVDPKSVNPKRRMDVIKTVAETLEIPFRTVLDIYARTDSRYVCLTTSSDDAAHKTLTNIGFLSGSGLSVEEKQVRRYPQGRRLSQVIGFVSKDPLNSVGGSGIELRYEKFLKGTPGIVRGMKTAQGREVRMLRDLDIDSRPGCNVFLTIDHNIQYETEKILAEGLQEYQASSAWAIILQVKTGAVLALACLPDFEPEHFNRFSAETRKNRAISECYEPGSVMKVITACAALNENLVTPNTLINTARNDPAYYRLPGDGSHHWEPFMTVRDALVHSSNIVFGKLGVNLGARRLWTYMTAFGFGRMTGIELPGEETGLLPNWKNWDKVKWSRAPIGQGVAVTGIQLAAAYAAIANDGELLRPYIVEQVVNSDGEMIYSHKRHAVGRPIRPEVARKVRDMMRGVAKKGGTARRAAVPGYSVAGKTGTAQMRAEGGRGYSITDYNASFVGIVPAGSPELVILVTYQKPLYNRRTFTHQGGMCSGPTFRRIAEKALRYLEVPPDIPEEVPEEGEEDDE